MSNPEHPTLDFTANGKPYRIDFSDLTGRDAKAFRKAVGTSLLSALTGVSSGDLDPLEFVAGFKWLMDRKDDPKLDYDDVLGSLTYDSISLEVEDEPDAADPPSGASSAPASPPSPITSESSPGKSTSSPSERSMSSASS